MPPGATLHGYESFVVQDLEIKSVTTMYERARYDLAEGGSVLTPFPPGVLPVAGGHFGAGLVVYVLDQYHQAGVTEPILLEQLWEYGIDISAGQLHRLLTENHDSFHQEKAEVLAVGLAESSFIGTDDTGARHQGKNGYCTVICNDPFAYFESTDNKSRLNFLQVLQGPQRDCAINETTSTARDALILRRAGGVSPRMKRTESGANAPGSPFSHSRTTLAYWQRQKLPAAPVRPVDRGAAAVRGRSSRASPAGGLARHGRAARAYGHGGGLVGRLERPRRRADLGGTQRWRGAVRDPVHAACWVHAERPLAQLVPYNDEHRVAIDKLRTQIWDWWTSERAIPTSTAC